VNHTIEKLPVLVIHAHTRCNCRCVMCDIWKSTESREVTPEQLEAQMPAIDRLGVRWVVFTGGEPLMHSDLFTLARRLRKAGVRVTILSTGLLLGRFACEIVAEIDDVIVSLDGPEEIHDRIRRVPGSFRAIADGVAALHSLEPTYRLSARSTVQKQNHGNLIETVEAAQRIGLASISFLAADVGSDAFGRAAIWPGEKQADIALTAGEIVTLEKQIEQLIEGCAPFVADSPEHLRRIARHFRAHLGLQPFQAPRCNAPWKSAVLETNGDVRPCFFHPVAGSAVHTGLDDVLNRPEALRFRESLHVAENPVCQRCVCSLYVLDQV
jgi:MoaA/NifB/PqqE/SkfB family radical SAM enzyme